ncbi:GNAT family N-acetyltransferase [Candidatus Saccharibacteria bacterium]|nr:GNAT family N-acetyltransferase [Candidatus Saccharibacteria bacterium]
MNVEIRNLNLNDDLGRAGELIFQVDPFICPDFFGDIERARKISPIIFNNDGGLFDLNHTLVAEANGKLQGILVFADNKIAAWNTNEIKAKVESLGIEMPENFDRANGKYMKLVTDEAMTLPNGVAEVELCSVESNIRNLGIGQKLFDEFLKNPTYHEHHLTVLADNPRAIHVYRKKGFEIVSSQTGYPDESVKTYNMVRKA